MMMLYHSSQVQVENEGALKYKYCIFSAPAVLILMFTECDESWLYLHFI